MTVESYIGEIKAVAFDYVPTGWMFCDGRTLEVSKFQALYALLGTKYGGDGRSTFKLPDLRGRVAIGFGQAPGRDSYKVGDVGGVERVRLTEAQMPRHSHNATLVDAHVVIGCSTQTATSSVPTQNSVLAKSVVLEGRSESGENFIYNENTPNTNLSPSNITGSISVADSGGDQTHSNMQPYSAINYIIAVEGVWPERQ